MQWKKRVFTHFRLYAVTHLEKVSSRDIRSIDQALTGGVDIIQLRSKVVSDRALFEIGKKIKQITQRQRKLFFVNDRVDLALALDADGIHVGQDDMPVADIRRICRRVGKKLFIGKSTHSFAQARRAQKEGVDYIGVGPVFATPTKKEYIPVGLNLIQKVKKEISLPFVCIGGINNSNIDKVLERGAGRVAVVRAIFDARDPKKAAAMLKKKLMQHAQKK